MTMNNRLLFPLHSNVLRIVQVDAMSICCVSSRLQNVPQRWFPATDERSRKTSIPYIDKRVTSWKMLAIWWAQQPFILGLGPNASRSANSMGVVL